MVVSIRAVEARERADGVEMLRSVTADAALSRKPLRSGTIPTNPIPKEEMLGDRRKVL